MIRSITSLGLAGLVALSCATAGGPAPEPPAEETLEPPAAVTGPTLETVEIHSPGSPLVALRLLFQVGSIHDPEGKEGLAALTGLMLGRAGTGRRSYADLVDALYPMAASIEVDTDREVTVISGEIHREKLDEFVALLSEAVLEPGFSESDFKRNKEQLKTFLTDTLRASNDELLGLEALQQVIFDDHPYSHSPAGTVSGLESITLADVREFYRRHFTRANLMLGIAGGYPDGYLERLVERFSALSPGERSRVELPAPAPIEGRRFTLIEKSTASVGIHFGYPLGITRADPDYYPLMVANSFLGEHRTFHGRLMQQLRGKRGLNYGDYSYIEHWHLPPFTTNPSPNVPRRQQFFSVWIRPVEPQNAHFALRNALYEVDRLVRSGLTQQEFELTRDFLINYSKLWAQTLSDRLGFLMDSRFYGMDYYIDEIERRLRGLTVEEVNAAVRRYVDSASFQAVLVTADAAAVKAALEAGEPSPLTYNSPPEAEVVEADATIQKLPVGPAAIEIVPVDRMFQ